MTFQETPQIPEPFFRNHMVNSKSAWEGGRVGSFTGRKTKVKVRRGTNNTCVAIFAAACSLTSAAKLACACYCLLWFCFGFFAAAQIHLLIVFH